MTFTLLLTCTCSVQDNISWLKNRDSRQRRDHYIKNIKKWLTQTNLDIVIVENSNYNFKELEKDKSDKLEIITFDYSMINIDIKKKLKSMNAKGQHEMFSINYALQHSKLLKKNDYILKLTGRYFIPNLNEILIKYNFTNFDYIIQNKIDPCCNNYYSKPNFVKLPKRCELLGCKKSLVEGYFKFPLLEDHMELEMHNRLNNSNILILPKLKLDKRTQQGAGAWLYEL